MLNKTGHDRSNPDGQLGAKELMAIGDALVSSGLRDKGYQFVNMDGGWSGRERLRNGTITVDPNLFPAGIAPVASYLDSKGLKMGIYTSRGKTTCGGWDRPGSEGYEFLDAAQCAAHADPPAPPHARADSPPWPQTRSGASATSRLTRAAAIAR